MNIPGVTDRGPIDQFLDRFADERVRTLLFAGLGGLALLFAALFLRGSDVGALLVAVIGAAGLTIGWRASPGFVLLILLYFLIFPDGIPELYPDEEELEFGHFRVGDLLLVAALVVYLSAHYRLFSITTHAMPAEGRSKAGPWKRPAGLIRRGELLRLLYGTAAFVVAGQIVWGVVATVEVDVLAPFPFYLPEDATAFRRRGGDLNPWLTRLVALAGLLFFGTLLARLVFGYWRLRLLTPAEGAMLLTNTGWEETHRERVRVEGWRMWAVRKVADRVRAGWKRPGKGGTK